MTDSGALLVAGTVSGTQAILASLPLAPPLNMHCGARPLALELPTSGQVFLGGEDVSYKRASMRDIAFVFQLFALYPHMNVRKNIAFPLLSQGMPREEIDRRVAEAARTLRITELLDKPVSGLTSGDRQRVALGRAIVRQPMAFMMDEPLGALDSEFRELMCHELRALHDRLKATTVYVTHDQVEAMSMADTIAIMNQGVIEQLGAIALRRCCRFLAFVSIRWRCFGRKNT